MDCMIDLETIGQQPDAGILTIGAMKFDRNSAIIDGLTVDEMLADEKNFFYRRITAESLNEGGFSHDQAALDWWGRQPQPARNEAFAAEPRISIHQALTELWQWCDGDRMYWSHGSDFDLVLLKVAFSKFNMETPWGFWNTRDTRTLFDLCNLGRNEQKRLRSPLAHHALVDTYDQAKMVVECYSKHLS